MKVFFPLSVEIDDQEHSGLAWVENHLLHVSYADREMVRLLGGQMPERFAKVLLTEMVCEARSN